MAQATTTLKSSTSPVEEYSKRGGLRRIILLLATVEATDANGLPTTFTLKRGTRTIGATVAYVEDTQAGTYRAILTPTGRLRSGVTYTATLTTAGEDLAGNELEQDPNAAAGIARTWRFRVR